jgi:copper chaperone
MCDDHGNHDHGGANCTCDVDLSTGHAHADSRSDSHSHPHGHEHSQEQAAAVATLLSTELGVQGMTCSHCVASVTEELSRLAGVTNVNVDLVAGGISRVIVDSDTVLEAQEIEAAIDEAGYELVDLPR